MAHALGEPEAYEDEESRRRYPWAAWFSRPFQEWILQPDTDFDVDPKIMRTNVYVAAKRRGLAVVVSIDDPLFAGRLALCAYESNDMKPLLRFSGFVTDSNDSIHNPNLVDVVCTFCKRTQQRRPDLAHLTECIERTPKNPLATYAVHRPDSSNEVGLAELNMRTMTFEVSDER